MWKRIAVGLALFLPGSLWAQGTGSVLGSTETARPYGSGQRSSLGFAGEYTPEDVIQMDLGYQAAYDDNIMGSPTPRIDDEVQNIFAHISFVHDGTRISALVDYLPYYEFYQKTTPYNRFDQTLASDVNFGLSERWGLRLRDTFTDMTGSYFPQTGATASDAIGPPTSLNATVYSPVAAERDNNSRVDLAFQTGKYSTLDFFGSYERRVYTEKIPLGASLLNTSGTSGGAEYTWRPTAHLTAGLLYLYQRMDLSGALPEGSAERMETQGAFPSLGWRIHPHVELDVFAGPQFVTQMASQRSAASLDEVDWSAGGSVSAQSERSSMVLSGQRMVNDGGGYLTFVTESYLEGTLRHRLYGQWEATLDAAVVWNQGLGLGSTSDLTAEHGSLGLVHPVHQNLVARIGYDFVRQTSTGQAPVNADFHRNRITVGFFYQLRPISARR